MSITLKSASIAAVFGAVLLSGCAPTAGDLSGGKSFLAQNDLQVIADPANPGQFEVLTEGGNGGPDYWCSAGDYAQRRLGAGATTRVFLVKPYGRSQIRSSRNSVGYSINPSAGVLNQSALNSGRITMSMNKIGENYTTAHARNVCDKMSLNRF